MIEQAKQFLFGRQQAYRQRLGGKDPATLAVLADLARFCRANDTTFHPDPRVQAALEGRREVWLRLQHNLKLGPDQLWELYGKKE